MIAIPNRPMINVKGQTTSNHDAVNQWIGRTASKPLPVILEQCHVLTKTRGDQDETRTDRGQIEMMYKIVQNPGETLMNTNQRRDDVVMKIAPRGHSRHVIVTLRTVLTHENHQIDFTEPPHPTTAMNLKKAHHLAINHRKRRSRIRKSPKPAEIREHEAVSRLMTIVITKRRLKKANGHVLDQDLVTAVDVYWRRTVAAQLQFLFSLFYYNVNNTCYTLRGLNKTKRTNHNEDSLCSGANFFALGLSIDLTLSMTPRGFR